MDKLVKHVYECNLKRHLTMVTKHKETTSTEVAVELDEDLIGRAVDRLQGCVTTELTDLG